MKKPLLITITLLMWVVSFSQQMYMEYGTTVSSFDYQNSQGLTIDNLLSQSKTYLGMGYRDNINNAKTLFYLLERVTVVMEL